MMKTARALLASLVVLSAGALISGCQSDPDIDITKLGLETDPPDVLYNQGLANMKAGNMAEAARKFDAIDRENPFSEWARKALVMSTFVKYRQGRLDDALASGNRYMAQYPKSEDAAYVQYLIGLTYSKQIVRRDAGPARIRQDRSKRCRPSSTTIRTRNMSTTRRRRSASPATSSPARKCRSAATIMERKEYLAAISRFRIVVEKYPNTNQIEEALARLVEAYYAMGIVEEAQTAAAVLGHNYPDSQWYADSYKLLQSGGAEPRENQGSWIAAAGKKLLLGS